MRNLTNSRRVKHKYNWDICFLLYFISCQRMNFIFVLSLWAGCTCTLSSLHNYLCKDTCIKIFSALLQNSIMEFFIFVFSFDDLMIFSVISANKKCRLRNYSIVNYLWQKYAGYVDCEKYHIIWTISYCSVQNQPHIKDFAQLWFQAQRTFPLPPPQSGFF